MTVGSANTKSPYELISRYRSELMGFCILFVLYYHSALNSSSQFLQWLKMICYGAVDIFMLVSGMGIYRSLESNSVSVFFRNRLKKIVPIWYLYYVIVLLAGHFFFNDEFRIHEISGFLTFTGYWLGLDDQGNWYVYAIMLFYLCSPVLAAMIRDSRNRLRTGLLMVLLSIFLSFAFFDTLQLMAFTRLPSYILGMVFAACFRDRPFDRKGMAVSLGVFLVGAVMLSVIVAHFTYFLWYYGLLWYPFIFIAPPVTLFFCLFLDKLEALLRPLTALLRILGRASLEILVISDFIFIRCGEYVYRWAEGHVSPSAVSVALFFAGALGGIAFHAVVERVKTLVSSCHSRLKAGAGA
ncbi:MAG: acyltransferase [Oscillospiraceae bacterium]|nr:acyltransferase [Oscillospiraceae bacterium]